MSLAVRADVTLNDKYAARSGRVLISGIQALVRLTLEQRRLDDAHGLDTALYMSGYQGSPLGGLDGELQRAERHTAPLGIVFQPGLNEELAATAVAGTQLLGEVAGRRHEGIVGLWFGKNPGLDRAADAIRHANVSGTAPLGGAVAIVGDDPGCKSSTIPSSCEPMCRSLLTPLLVPGDVAEIVTLGLHAVALSRASGLWSALKVVADVADASAVIDVAGLADGVPAPVPRERAVPTLLASMAVDAERDLLDTRLARVVEYARATHLNRVTFEPERPRIALVAAGVAYRALVTALQELGIDDAAKHAAGVRLVQLGMPWPLDGESVRELTAGVTEVVVLEDKLPFVESQLKELLFATPDAPLVLGRHDGDGRPLRPAQGTLTVEDVIAVLANRLDLPQAARARAQALARSGRKSADLPMLAARTPYFCSGCPHNRSTKAADDQLVGAGIGCHAMVLLDHGGRGQLLGLTQMGGEGAQWLGIAPFCDERHFVQNLGDGTFHHSGSLAIRAATAAGARITYKLLYNDAVAMTGGQSVQGRLDVPSLTRWFALEGVRSVIVIAAEPDAYKDVKLDPIAQVRHRDRLAESERELAGVDGVTVLVYDDRCANEERRMRKRGSLPAPAERVWINERVCEGCGDCGRASTCLSVLPVETDLGRKTRIHQSSCNQDFSCLDGDCPSFVVVTPTKQAPVPPPEPPTALPDPSWRVPRDVLVRMLGIGGTGVVTISQVLQMAAHLDGRFAAGLEQIGLAQKGGPVVSDVRITSSPPGGTLRASTASADVLLGFDLLGAAAAQSLAVADPQRTVAVVNVAEVPTAAMVTDTAARFPPSRGALRRIDEATRREERLVVDAQALAERLFGDHMPANMLLVGAAFQHGCLPLSTAAIERAIELNGAAVATNLAAFAWGRAVVAAPEAVERVMHPVEAPPVVDPVAASIAAATGATGELLRLLEWRVADLGAYQDRGYAERYAWRVAEVAATAQARVGEAGAPVAEAYARGAYKLLAYKDEYEVARLHLDASERARLASEFGERAKVRILLHPPLLRALGLDRKLRLGPWVFPLLRLLRAGRRLRGTRLDPFGRGEVRRVERALIGEYEALTREALEYLRPEQVDAVTRVLALPDVVRGYEQIKLENVERFRRQAQELMSQLRASGAE